MISQVEIESLGFKILQSNSENGFMEYVFYKDDFSSYVLSYGVTVRGSKLFKGLFSLKEIDKSSITNIYTGPIRSKKELKFLISC